MYHTTESPKEAIPATQRIHPAWHIHWLVYSLLVACLVAPACDPTPAKEGTPAESTREPTPTEPTRESHVEPTPDASPEQQPTEPQTPDTPGTPDNTAPRDMTQQDTPQETTPEPTPTRWRVYAMSFNIRYGIAQDGDNHWNKRKPLVFDAIKKQQPDFLGLQEAWKFQMDEILQNTKGYQCFGRSRKANTDLDEWSPICYQSSRWTLDSQEQGVLWLSQTPDVPGSQSWESSLPRIATWGRFVDANGRGIYVFNTHYDHKSQQARLESSKLLSRRIAGRLHRNEPVLLMGDFNAGESNDAITFLKGKTIGGQTSFVTMIDTYRELYPKEKNAGTFHGWNGRKNGSRIDYVFAIKGYKGQRVESATIHYDNDNGRYPSDHFPVSTVVSYDSR